MRVALLTTFHQRDGLATYAESLASALQAQGAEVAILAPRLTKGDAPVGAPPQRLWGGSRATIVEAAVVTRAIAAVRADVVHLNVNLSLFSARFLFTLTRLLRARGVPVVATMHGRDGGSLLRRLRVALFSRALTGVDLVVHNEAHRAELRASGHASVQVIPHGIPHMDNRSMVEARRLLAVDLQAPMLVHFGFLFPHKGVLEVLRAVRQLRAQRFPDLRYRVVGGVYRTRESRRYFASIRAEIAALRLDDAVDVTGEFLSDEEASLAMQAASWVVLNYQHGSSQGTSGAVTRALSSGRPVAVSGAGVFDDVRSSTHTLSGDLASALGSMLEDESLAIETVRRARARCEALSWERVAARYVELYRDLVDREVMQRA